MKHKIGYACISQISSFRTSRRMILKDFSDARFIELASQNLDDLLSLLKWNLKNGISMFRISSDIIPLASHPINTIHWWDVFADKLTLIGRFIKENKIRVSMHPGQYTVLNSPDDDVVNRSVEDLRYHSRFLDAMDLSSHHKLILHIGGLYGDKESAKQRFIENYHLLEDAIKSRLILENDDKCYTALDVLQLCREVKAPMVLDNLHHELNHSDIEWSHLLAAVVSTWKPLDGRPKFHYSDQDPWEEKNGHSQTIHSDKFLSYFASIEHIEVDIMLEVKDKDISCLKANTLLEMEDPMDIEAILYRYKYLIMETGAANYDIAKSMTHSADAVSNLLMFIDACLLLPFDESSFSTSVTAVYSLIEDVVTLREHNHLKKIMEVMNPEAIKRYLHRLVEKYECTEILNTYYFEYSARYKHIKE